MARKKVDTEQARTLPDHVVAAIRADVERHRPGLWAEEYAVEPACLCGANFRAKWVPEGLQSYTGDIYRGCARHD